LETMVVNRLENRWTWPGTEFVVDKFPDFGVLMCRPIKDSPEYVPWPWGYTVTIYCRNAAALAAAIRREDFVDWTQEVLFWVKCGHQPCRLKQPLATDTVAGSDLRRFVSHLRSPVTASGGDAQTRVLPKLSV
ncbi:hypothetical protein BV898_19570, partial [Hypsibius exemplaris]